MAEIPNYAPSFQIPIQSFKRDTDPYSQILPMLLQGQADQRENRKRQLLAGMFQDNPQLNAIAQVDPAAAMKVYADQQNQSSAFLGPQGQFSQTQQPGFSPFGRVDRDKLMAAMAAQQEKGNSLAERAKDAELSRQLQSSQQEISRLVAMGNYQAAVGRIEEAKQAMQQRATDAAAARKVRAESENAKYPVQNFWRSMTGRGPVVSLPGDESQPQQGGGNVQVTNFKVTKR